MKQNDSVATCIHLTKKNHEALKTLKQNQAIKYNDLINQLLSEYFKSIDLDVFLKQNRDLMKKLIYDSIKQAQADILKRQNYILSSIYRNTTKTNLLDDYFFSSDSNTKPLVAQASKEADRKLKELKSKLGGICE